VRFEEVAALVGGKAGFEGSPTEIGRDRTIGLAQDAIGPFRC
jgi:hypothetical protein